MATASLRRFGPAEAEALAARALGTQRTKLGGLHIEHARRVAAAVTDEDDRVVVAALLHDVVEKTTMTMEELRAAVGDSWIIDVVDALTERGGESERDYLARCVRHPVAHRLKRLDLADKLVADDDTVPATVAAAVRSRARQRLALLDVLAAALTDGH